MNLVRQLQILSKALLLATKDDSFFDPVRHFIVELHTALTPPLSSSVEEIRFYVDLIWQFYGRYIPSPDLDFPYIPPQGISANAETVKQITAISAKLGDDDICQYKVQLSSTALKGANMVEKRNSVFIGHGHSQIWRDLKDFIQDRLHLPWDEFNREPVAGITTTERLSQMLENATMAFLVLTAEDEQADGQRRARMNVVHEAGLFQGRLGFQRAIVFLEEGCEEFSNIHGLGHIRFSKGNISAKFEEIRRVLEREGLL